MKIKNYIPVILCSIALCSCSDADKNIAFGLDSDAIKAEAARGSHKIKVSASGDWVATTDEPWISISPANGRGTTECRILIDSALTDSPAAAWYASRSRTPGTRRRSPSTSRASTTPSRSGRKEVSVANFSAFGTRYFDVKVKTNVDFAVEVPTSAESWLKYDSYKVELDRGIRPREVTVRFNWSINSQPNERIADVVFKPKREVELARQDNLLVTQGAAEPIEENTRSGDSIALLAIARTLGTNSSWENGERMDNWDDVTLWEEGMAGYTPEKSGRVKYARFFMFDTKGRAAFRSAVPDGRRGTELLQQRQRLPERPHHRRVHHQTHAAQTPHHRRLRAGFAGQELHGAQEPPEFLDLSSNNFQKIPDEINPTNFPKLRTLLMGANTRRNIYDLSNTVETNYGGLVDEEGFPRRMIEWDLDTLQLSVNYLQGPLPKMDDWEKYTEQDIIDADTLPRALIGTPKVMPHTKRFAINLNRLTGELPDWLLYHPPPSTGGHPSSSCSRRKVSDATGASAGFGNEPANLNYYYNSMRVQERPRRRRGRRGYDQIIKTMKKLFIRHFCHCIPGIYRLHQRGAPDARHRTGHPLSSTSRGRYSSTFRLYVSKILTRRPQRPAAAAPPAPGILSVDEVLDIVGGYQIERVSP